MDNMKPALDTASFRTKIGTREVSQKEIRTAMREFDSTFRSKESDSGTLYAVEDENGKRYPPKRILELATGVPRNQFSGGKPSNDVFVTLGFHIADADEGKVERTAGQFPREDGPIPDANELLRDLFAKTWVPLDDDSEMADSQYPGVYVLAYPDEKLLRHPVKENLTGEPVREEDIFYVGVSHAGVCKRLRQFAEGLEKGGHHSGAERFFERVANGKPYSELTGGKSFFVAFVSVPCITIKPARKPLHLRKMGIVAQLEWYVLAKVKEKTHVEPWLNKK